MLKSDPTALMMDVACLVSSNMQVVAKDAMAMEMVLHCRVSTATACLHIYIYICII